MSSVLNKNDLIYVAGHNGMVGSSILRQLNAKGFCNILTASRKDVDLTNPVISSLYPYQSPFPDEKNSNGIRYNVLPKNKQTLDHTPVGTFPKKREILDDETILEIYEKYYKYTTTTNNSRCLY